MFTPPFPRAEADGSDSGEAQLEDSKIRLGDVDPSRRGIIDTIIRETKANISAHIKLVTMDPAAYADGEAGFVREFMAQACAKEKGPADSVTPQVAILFDVKNSGEASHRPALRMPPLTDQRYGPKIKMVMERFGAPEPDPATGQAVPTISSSDVFLVMNGGKDGNQAEFMKPFAGAKKFVKNITLFREEESAMNRLGKVQGYATLNCLREFAGCAGREEQSEEGDLRTLSDMQHTLEHGGPDRHAAFRPGMAFAMENQEGALRQSPHFGRGTGARC